MIKNIATIINSVKARRFQIVLTCLTLSLTPFSCQGAWPAKINNQPMPSLAPMLENVLPAVVNISVTTQSQAQKPLFQDPFFQQFFNIPDQQSRAEQSAGSGVIIDAKNGYIVTNHHVIKGAESVKVTLFNGVELNANLIGSDEPTDIALLQVNVGQLKQFPLGDSDVLRIGDFVVAVGNPFGLGHSVTSGIVSALGRSGLGIERYEDFIQTDASINPGNSGGALVNLRGELIGINTAIIAPAGGNIGIGFSIPINRVRQLTAQLVKYGNIRRGILGVVSRDLPVAYRTNPKASTQRGALITEVIPRSSAAKAGLTQGDIIVNIDDEVIDSSSDLQITLGLIRAGEIRRVKFWRGEKLHTIEVVITDPSSLLALNEQIYDTLKGASFLDITLSTRSGPRGAILVSKIRHSSSADKLGLQRDDIIIAAGKFQVESIAQLRKVIEQANSTFSLTLERNGKTLLLPLQ